LSTTETINSSNLELLEKMNAKTVAILVVLCLFVSFALAGKGKGGSGNIEGLCRKACKTALKVKPPNSQLGVLRERVTPCVHMVFISSEGN